MFIFKCRRCIFLLITVFLVIQIHAQQNGLTLQDTIIFSDASFTSYNSITAGPNLLISAIGDLTLNTRENIYFKSAVTIVGGGKLQTINDQSIVNGMEDSDVLLIPDVFSVKQNYPNPFNPTTVISYTLPSGEDVSVIIYNNLGQEIRTLIAAGQQAGTHSVTWDGRTNSGAAVSNGSYFYMVKAGKFKSVKKMILVK